MAKAGDSLERPPRGLDPDHEAIEDLKRKDHIAVADLTSREVTSAKLLELLNERFSASKGYMKFLCAALELPF